MSDGQKERLPQLPGLGRHLWHDPRNKGYPIRPLLREISPSDVNWWARHVTHRRSRLVFNQGRESSCTAQAAIGLVSSLPHRMSRGSRGAYNKFGYDDRARFDLYLRAQEHDPWEGGEPTYYGSSTDAPFIVLRNAEFIREWRWIFGIEDLLDTLRLWGPCAIGTWWYSGMDYPDDHGLVQISGRKDGGHAYLALFHDEKRDEIEYVNSWGKEWGNNGRFRMSVASTHRLLEEQGEAVTIVP